MRFVILFVVAIISACGTKLPSPPQHYQHTFIDDYVYGVAYYDNLPDKKQSFNSFLQQQPVCVTLNDYKLLKKYVGDVLQMVKDKCPALKK